MKKTEEKVAIERTTAGIRDFMFDEMEKLANGDIDIERLKAMSKAGDTILKAAATDIQHRKLLQAEREGSREPKAIADMNLNIMLGSKDRMIKKQDS